MYKKEECAKEQRWQLNLQFGDGLQAILAALNAGYSIENTFSEAVKDLKLLYPGQSDIMKEFEYITKQLERNRTIEELLENFAERSHVEDIYEFSEVFLIAKRSGGNLLKIIRGAIRNINDRMEVEREIKTMIMGKKMEANIMNLVPLGIICYLRFFTPGFLDCLYNNPAGVCFMSAALIFYAGAFWLSYRLADIEV